MIPDDCIVLQSPGKGICRAVIPPVLRDCIQCLDTACVLILIIPFLKLLEERICILRSIGNVVRPGQRLLKLIGFGLILIICIVVFILVLELYGFRFTPECMEACPWQIGLPEEVRCQIKSLFDIPCDKVHITIVEASCATCESECFRSVSF